MFLCHILFNMWAFANSSMFSIYRSRYSPSGYIGYSGGLKCHTRIYIVTRERFIA